MNFLNLFKKSVVSPETSILVELPFVEETEDNHKVPYTAILNISPHNNAERLEIATVYGFQIVVQKGVYSPGDKIILIPIDSIIPQWLENQLFPPDSKIKLHRHRIRQIKIRGFASQGMIVNPKDVASVVNPEYLTLEQNLKLILGVKKYQPPQPGFAGVPGNRKNRNKKNDNPLFHKYNGLENIKWFPDLFTEGEEVAIQEKLHGTNCRLSILPFTPNTLFKRALKWLKLSPQVEKCYGSNNVEISASSSYKGFYGEDIYGSCLKATGAFDKIKYGEIVYGEIIGPGIQKNYNYSLKEHHFVVFDVKTLQPDGKFKWMSPDEVEAYTLERGFERVPVLYKGPFNKELTYSMTKGKSVYDPRTKVREGIVIKAKDYDVFNTKKALKWISEDYLADDQNSDFH